MGQLGELGCYLLAGHAESPRALVDEVRDAEDLGLGSVFVSERFNVKDACALSGAAGATSTTLGIATAATNHNTRHPLVTATFATTMHRLTGGRFALGLGRGFDFLFDVMGTPRVTLAQLEDFVAIMRKLWHGEAVVGHDGPAGRFDYLSQDPGFDEDIPILMVAMGPRTLECAGRIADGVVLHTFMTDEAVARSVDAVRLGAEMAGRDPTSVRIWSVLATVGDHIDEAVRLRKLAGRFATYLQGYGDLLVSVNGWDPSELARIRAHEMMTTARGAIDATATTDELRVLTEVLPDEWLAASATGNPHRCATTVAGQFAAGADSVILHGATPSELAPVVDAYRSIRPAGLSGAHANPGR